jgi:hypothetical protein
VGSSSRPAVRPVQEDQQAARPRIAPGGSSTFKARRDPSRRVDPQRRSEERATPSFRRLRPPRLGHLEEVPVGEINKLGGDAERAAGGGSWRYPAAPSVIDYPGRWSPGHAGFPCRQRGPRAVPCRRGGPKDSPQAVGERSTVVEAAGRSGGAPESVGTKRAAPKQGSSDRPVKRSRVSLQAVSPCPWSHRHRSFFSFAPQPHLFFSADAPTLASLASRP